MAAITSAVGYYQPLAVAEADMLLTVRCLGNTEEYRRRRSSDESRYSVVAAATEVAGTAVKQQRPSRG